MASLTIDNLTRRVRVLFQNAAGKRRAIHLGRLTARAGEAFAAKLQQLIDETRHDKPSAETVAWLTALPLASKRKLARHGLIVLSEQRTLGRYLAQREAAMGGKDATQTFYAHTFRNLRKCFGPETPMSDLAGVGRQFREYLVNDEHLAPATVNRRIRAAKTIFRPAVGKLIDANPIDVKSGATHNDERKVYVPAGIILDVLANCPDPELRTMLALARFGGLRCMSEMRLMTHERINRTTGTMGVQSPKTEHHQGKGFRLVPLFVDLLQWLPMPSRGSLFPRLNALTDTRVRTMLVKLVRRCGHKQWLKPWQNLRASCETDLMATYPIQVVAAWMGHSPTVALTNYAMVPDAYVEHAAGIPNTRAQKPARARNTAQATTRYDRLQEKPARFDYTTSGITMSYDADSIGRKGLDDRNIRRSKNKTRSINALLAARRQRVLLRAFRRAVSRPTFISLPSALPQKPEATR